jgi:hypothetical protein
MMTRIIVCFILLIAPATFGQGVKPDHGFVPDSKTAVRVAEAVLIPVYGEKKIESERPFKAVLKDGEWTVTGTLTCPDGHGGVSTLCLGGTAVVRIAKSDGRILFMTHYK